MPGNDDQAQVILPTISSYLAYYIRTKNSGQTQNKTWTPKGATQIWDRSVTTLYGRASVPAPESRTMHCKGRARGPARTGFYQRPPPEGGPRKPHSWLFRRTRCSWRSLDSNRGLREVSDFSSPLIIDASIGLQERRRKTPLPGSRRTWQVSQSHQTH